MRAPGLEGLLAPAPAALGNGAADESHAAASPIPPQSSSPLAAESLSGAATGSPGRVEQRGRLPAAPGSGSLVDFLADANDEHISILVVDDEPAITMLMAQVCKRLRYKFDCAGNAEEALQKFRAGDFHIIVADIGLPGIDGLELMRLMKREQPSVDVIIVTGYVSTHSYAAVVRHGASDFLAKPFAIDEFQAKVQRVIRERRLIAELERKSALLKELSITDDLTSLYNYRCFNRELRQEMTRARRQGTDLSLLLLDLDRFKDYNDQHGHRAGDELLRSIGAHLPGLVRHEVDKVFRYGGDEFAVLLVQTTLAQATEIAEEIFASCAVEFPLTLFSIGVAQLGGEMSLEEFFEAADRAMYQAKLSGGKRVCVAA
ncbi:MAG: diguanylate cyclase [Candidatus Tectomicrobia bacterium]|nr:diguanylate cyclase [Candidatus Tectomicrobia bacterium]